ncbi:MAG: lysophospholipid acyltransferase family protein [Granulosicoccus sp.]
MNFKLWHKRVAARVLPPVVSGLIRLIWKTCRVHAIVGEEHLQPLLDSGEPFIPCYWHQHQIFCVRYLLDTASQHEHVNLGYLISPSSDGDMAATIFDQRKVHIVRGSATRGGAQALREIYVAIKQQKISPIVTPDGPTGPIYECKPGVPMLARISQCPMLPMAYAATHAIKLRSWDKFMLPVPFSRIVIGIGPALHVPKDQQEMDITTACSEMNERLQSVALACEHKVTD